jgi:hypothetical protein
MNRNLLINESFGNNVTLTNTNLFTTTGNSDLQKHQKHATYTNAAELQISN